MSEHTRGKWRTAKDTGHERVISGNRMVADCAIAGPGKRFKPEENRANARLIAAAPDLLRAAEMALEALEDGEGRGFQSGDNAYLALQDAIAKAGGKG